MLCASDPTIDRGEIIAPPPQNLRLKDDGGLAELNQTENDLVSVSVFVAVGI